MVCQDTRVLVVKRRVQCGGGGVNKDSINLLSTTPLNLPPPPPPPPPPCPHLTALQ